MEQDKYRMKLLNIERLPEETTYGSVRKMIEENRRQWREQHLSKEQIEARMLKKLDASERCVDDRPDIYRHAYNLLHLMTTRRGHRG